MKLAQQGQGGALNDLFDFLRKRMLALARYRVQEAAEDLVQETLVIVYAHLSEFDSLEGMLAFTNQVLRNKIGNIYQKRDRHKHRALELEDAPPIQYRIDGEMEAAELDQIMRECINRLGENRPDCRKILACLYDGFDSSEISERLGIAKSTLKVRVFRCREALRKVLDKDYGLQV
jgi:RNA polymerase sigma factor (sigma-70 family)